MKRTKNAKGEALMSAALQMHEELRSKADLMVRHIDFHCSSRMEAYGQVGKWVGKSGSWVRGFIKGYSDASPNLKTIVKIQEAYERICVRVEQKAENERLLERATLNAINARAMGVVESIPESAAKRNEDTAI